MRTESRRTYIQILSNSQQIEVLSHLSREVLRKTTSTDAAIEKVLRNKAKTQEEKLDQSTSCQEAIKGPGTFSIDPPSCRGSVEIAIRKSLRARQIAKCQGGIEEVSRLLKNYFSRREKHIYECNQACNSTKDLINILSSQNHLSIKNFKHNDPKNTHTH